MARKYLTFDIETATDVPGPDFNWRPHRPLGITCVAALPYDANEPTVWYAQGPEGEHAERMACEEARHVVECLGQWVADGYTVLTWNGLGFDFDILAEESGAFEACKDLALNHVDMMFHVLCDRGFPVALDKAAQAMGIKGKPAGMTGQLAPRLWIQGRYQEVIEYVAQDVRIALQIAQACETSRSFKWSTRRGTTGFMPLDGGWLSVRDALRLPEPDTSWMSNPLLRQTFTEWLTKA